MNDNILYFNQKVTAFNFYTEFLEDLEEFFKANGENIPPILSLEYTEFIDPGVLNNIIGTGLLLKEFYKQPIQLLLNYRPKLIYFLYQSRFFTISNQYSGLHIFDYDEKFIGGFDMLLDKHHQEEHVIHRYSPSKQYYLLETEDEQLDYRKNLIRILRDEYLRVDYKPVLEFLGRIEKFEIDLFLDILSEIISNSILYSLSESFATVFANKFKTIISITDIGIGFYEALLKKKNYNFSFSEKLKRSIRFTKELEDFVTIFEVLNYSKNNNRFNLWSLKEMVVRKQGVFRLHYKTTQLVFSKKCRFCTKSDDLLECANCFLRNYNQDLIFSPLRIFNHTYNGVHIEIELQNSNDLNHV